MENQISNRFYSRMGLVFSLFTILHMVHLVDSSPRLLTASWQLTAIGGWVWSPNPLPPPSLMGGYAGKRSFGADTPGWATRPYLCAPSEVLRAMYFTLPSNMNWLSTDTSARGTSDQRSAATISSETAVPIKVTALSGDIAS
nr:hypothetical protein [Morchella crassipes]